MKHVCVPAGADAGVVHRQFSGDLEIELGREAVAVVLEGCPQPFTKEGGTSNASLVLAEASSLSLIVLHARPLNLKAELASGARLLVAVLGEAELTVGGGEARVFDARRFLAGLEAASQDEKRRRLGEHFEPVARLLPLEFSVELERLLDLLCA